MIDTTSQDNQGKGREMIDYLEDANFRDWVLHPRDMNDIDIASWKEEVKEFGEAARARYILLSLQLHFEKQQMSAEEIDLKVSSEIDKYRIKSGVQKKIRLSERRIWRVAAAVVLLIGVVFLLRWINRPLDVYTTDYGEQVTIVLPDASVIQLNSNSTLTWDRTWKKNGQRMVDLKGEAYFSVEQKEGMPFRVQTDDLTVNVTGTEFNVNSRRHKTMVFLEEGKVDVEVKQQPEKKYKMEPGEELTYEALVNKVEQRRIEESAEVSGWKEGLLIFRDEPLLKVLESVSDIYGKEFVTKDSALLHRNITTTIPLTNWEVSLTAIQLAMKLEVEEAKDTVRIRMSPAGGG